VTRHVRVRQVSSQLTTTVSTTNQRTVDRTEDGLPGEHQHLSDDEDGHLLYSEGTVLNDRCKNHVRFSNNNANAPTINKSSFEIASTTLRLVLFIYCFHFKSAFPPRCWLSPVFQLLFFSFSRNENFSSRGLNNTYDLDLLT